MSEEIISFTPSSDVIESVRKELGLDEKRIKEALDGIKKWLALQPHLPKEEDDGRLERWLIRCKNNMEKTKEALDLYYSLKTIAPEVMCDRDPNESFMEDFCKIGYFILMPGMTSEYDRVVVCSLTNPDADLFNFCHAIKIMIMGLELRMCEDYFLKDILIVDCRNITINHIPKIQLPLVKKCLLCALKGCSWRLRAIHIINLPHYGEVLVNLFKKFMKQKLIERIHVHGSDLTELHKQVPKHLLPKELGGDGVSIEVRWDQGIKKIKSYRDWYLKQEQMKADESKRPPGQTKYSDMFGIDGSFRQLSID